MPEKGGDVVDVQGAKTMLNVSQATIYRMVNEGTLRPTTPGNSALQRAAKLHFLKADVERVMTLGRSARPPRKPRKKPGEA